MKRIVLCFDGTWQSVDDPSSITNVVRVAQAVLPVANGVEQICYYQAGVGSDGGIDRILGGAFGAGLRNNVKRALAYLSLNWNADEADEIYIFGFSRGAYTARAVAGVIGAVGGIPKQEHFDKLPEFWNYYRKDPKVRESNDPDAINEKKKMRDWCYPDDKDRAASPIITCLGVWDTVGSYGIPAGFGLGGLARRLTSWTKGFHDREFGSHVGVGLHALALDERRRGFPPTAWTVENGKPLPDGHVEQVWFSGVHSNVGGSYPLSGLSDIALIWMMARVADLTELEFDKDFIADNFWPCAACSLYNSVPRWALLDRLLPNRRKVLSDRPDKYINEMVHWSVIDRLGKIGIVDETRYAAYRPRNLPEDLDGYIARKTDREIEFINACLEKRNACPDGRNARLDGCVLERAIDETKRDRRTRRLARLQKSWPVSALIRTGIGARDSAEDSPSVL
jgi:uncharacterized protein (DUF2235 family)